VRGGQRFTGFLSDPGHPRGACVAAHRADARLIYAGQPMTELDSSAILAVAHGAPVRLSEASLAEVAANRDRVEAALRAADRPVYGVHTGMGRLVDRSLDAEAQAAHQANLLIGRAVGGPPWLPEPDVRALLAVRLRGFLEPSTGVSVELVRFLAARLDDGFVPAVPRDGLGSAGEIIPLSHAFQTFLGVGTVLEKENEVPAAVALARRGVRPFVLRAKEGVSLIQGSPLAIAHALMRAAEARKVVALQRLATALTIDALGAPLAIYNPALAGSDAVLAAVLTDLRALTQGVAARPEVVQAPVSVRVGPQALAHALRTVDELAATAEILLGAPTDSPAFVAGNFVSTGGFHAVGPGLRIEPATGRRPGTAGRAVTAAQARRRRVARTAPPGHAGHAGVDRHVGGSGGRAGVRVGGGGAVARGGAATGGDHRVRTGRRRAGTLPARLGGRSGAAAGVRTGRGAGAAAAGGSSARAGPRPADRGPAHG
jgi:hypothetical protein